MKRRHKPTVKPKLPTLSKVKALKYGKTLEITNAISNSSPILVLPNHRYMAKATGEIKTMRLTAGNRADDLVSVKRTMRKLRRLVIANFSGGDDQLWITLTFKNNVQSPKDAYQAFTRFRLRMQRRYSVQYISVIEPQASGRWHFHVLLKSNDGSRLIIPNAEMAGLWNNGFVKVRRLRRGDNIASYLMGYLTNLNVENTSEITDKPSKRIIKGGRLRLYPRGVRIYRASKGIRRPKELKGFKGDILHKENVANNPSAVIDTQVDIDEGRTLHFTTEYYDLY